MSDKIGMPDYTKSGYVARHSEVKRDLTNRNQIKDSSNEVKGAKIERYHSPGAGHRVESIEANKRPARGNKIMGMSDAQRVTAGCPETLPKGKMRGE